MNVRRCITAGLLCLGVAQPLPAASVASHFPHAGLGQFLAEHFDLASIRSSLGPRRDMQRTFADFGMLPTKVTDTDLVYDMPGNWYYRLRVVGRRDVNRDGIEDLEVCFIDRAQNGATYKSEQALVITRYATGNYALALSFSGDDRLCEQIAD